MFYTIGMDECVRNVCLVSSTHDYIPLNMQEVISGYRKFCNEIGGNAVCPLIERERWLTNTSAISEITKHYLSDSKLTDIKTSFYDTPISARMEAKEFIDLALEEMHDLDSSLKSIFDLFIHTLFYQRSPHSGGGSVSSAPGVVWCSPRRDWSTHDTIEFFLHELTHNLLFIDERCYVHYISLDAIMQHKYYAMSSILKSYRPMDKVFHSLVVANEVLLFRSKFGEPINPKVHPPSSSIIQSIARTIESIKVIDYDKIVTDRFIKIFDIIQQMNSIRLAEGL
jgi:hypothetical protein